MARVWARARLRAWPWSSYRGYAGLAKPEAMVEEELVLGEMGGQARKRRMQYRRFVESGLLEPLASPLAEARWQAVLGSESFEQRIVDQLAQWKDKRSEIKAVRHCGKGVEVEEIVRQVGSRYGLSSRAVREQCGRVQEAKGVALTLSWELSGLSLRELGEVFGGMKYAAVAQQVHRTRRREQERKLKFSLTRVRTICQRI